MARVRRFQFGFTSFSAFRYINLVMERGGGGGILIVIVIVVDEEERCHGRRR